MICKMQRAHSRIQKYVLIIPAVIPLVGLFFIIQHPQQLVISFIFLLIVFIICYANILYRLICYKKVFYDDRYIYIKSFLGKDQDVILYKDVIELKIHKSMNQRHGSRTAKHTLKYHTKRGIAKALFTASFYERQIDLLKRQISPEKVI